MKPQGRHMYNGQGAAGTSPFVSPISFENVMAKKGKKWDNL